MVSLYVIAANKDGPVKIGYSKNPNKRLKQLQTSNSEKLTLFYSAEFAEDKVKIAEGFVHGLSNQHRTSGEWFSISVEEAIWRIDYALIFHS